MTSPIEPDMTDPYMTENPSRGGIWVLATLMLVVAMAPDVLAQIPGAAVSPEPAAESQWESVLQAMRRIPLAAALGALLAFRPRRKGTPARTAAVVQTQIILAIVGAVVMLVVGSSVARAFGIVGVASLVRYRAKIDDPKDAGVMLCCLGVGLASGVGLYALAMFSAAFLIVLISVLEWLQPEAVKLFDVTVKSKKVADLRDRVEQIFKREI